MSKAEWAVLRARAAISGFLQRAVNLVAPAPPLDHDADLRLGEERAMIAIRWIGCLGSTILVPFLQSDRFIVAYVVLVLVFFYNAFMGWVLVPRGSRLLRGGYLGFGMDISAITAFVYAGGGVRSEYFVFYYVLQVFYSVRFPGKNALLIPLWISFFYVGACVLSSGIALADFALIVHRLTWVPVLGLFTGIGVGRARAAEASLAVELRRTRALLQAAHAPTTSLTVTGVLDAVLEQTKRLTESDMAAVVVDRIEQHSAVARMSENEDAALASLVQLLRKNVRARDALIETQGPVTPAELADRLSVVPAEIRQFTSICAASIPGQRKDLGFVVVARRQEPGFEAQHYEALTAFLQRATLAIQNARLYEQLQAQVEELRSLHDQIVGAERLAALGELAAKVAHELNNPLASIHMYNSLLLEGGTTEEEQARLAKSMQEQIERAKQVVMEVLDYSRPRPLLREVLDLNEAVRYGLRLVQHAARPAQVTIVEKYVADLPFVLFDRGHMSQIVTNLTLNAIQAMPGGGTLTISTGTADGEVYFEFRDTGVGIAPEDEKRVFDAFFTTKAPGQGTGLGLAVCRTLIGQHHGRITVDSQRGSGSTFRVWLPPAAVEEELFVGTNPR